MRKLSLLVAAVVLTGGTLTACFGGPPPASDPHDVLVVGDSVAFSFGCVLGDPIPGVPAGGCPARPGYTTHNESSGACTIYQGSLVLYNGGFAGAPSCDTNADSQGRTWQQAADFFTPKVVVINTAGWEIVDRYINAGQPFPDSQWGGPTNGPSNDPYHTAAAFYSNELVNAIHMFRDRGAKVIVANAPYIDPPEPLPPPSSLPPDQQGLSCSWWEPYDPSAPNSTGECQTGQPWRSPPGSSVSYRPSKTKMDQFNQIITQTLTTYFGSDPNVSTFNFKKHFNGPNNVYTSYVCAPPDDATVAPQNVLDFHSGVPAGTMAWQCDNGTLNSPANPWPYAILARADDNGHLSVAGQFQILQPYLEPCVEAALGVAGGDPSKCA